MAYVDWRIKGPELSACSCDWGCPCQFNALPSRGYCRAAVAMRIDEGHFGEVRLDGLHWAALLAWPGAIHHGNGELSGDRRRARRRAAARRHPHDPRRRGDRARRDHLQRACGYAHQDTQAAIQAHPVCCGHGGAGRSLLHTRFRGGKGRADPESGEQEPAPGTRHPAARLRVHRGGVRQQRDQDGGTRVVRVAARARAFRAAAPDAARTRPLARGPGGACDVGPREPAAARSARRHRRPRGGDCRLLGVRFRRRGHEHVPASDHGDDRRAGHDGRRPIWGRHARDGHAWHGPVRYAGHGHARHGRGRHARGGRGRDARDGHGRACRRAHVGPGGRGDGASRLDAGLRRPDVLHVVDHDDGDDAAERRAHGPPVRGHQPPQATRAAARRVDRRLRRRLSRGLGRVQPGCRVRAMGPRAAACSSPGRWQRPRAARRRAAAGGGRLPAHPAQARLPAPLPLARRLHHAALAAGDGGAFRHGPRARRLSASAAAGS